MSSDSDRFTVEDFLAVATLSVPLSGRAVQALLELSDDLTVLLSAVHHDRNVHLRDAPDPTLTALFTLQKALDEVPDVGHARRSKLLARKRPHLVPIRDQHVLTAFIGEPSGPLTEPLREELNTDARICERLGELRANADAPNISDLRTLDVIVWMLAHGDRQAPG